MILWILCVSIWRQMHSQKLRKNCQKAKKKKSKVSLFLEVESAPDL